jgi:ElaB/YqjD/DUF883 family membrane-anchored ribosome-binding protein
MKKRIGEKMANGKRDTEITNVRNRTHQGVDKIMDEAEIIRESGKEGVAYLKEETMMIKENVDGYIRKNPEKSVLIAAGVGAVVGAVLAAVMMRKR